MLSGSIFRNIIQIQMDCSLLLFDYHVYRWCNPYLHREFEEMAYDVLDEVAKSYPPKWTRVLVEHEFTNWGGLTILEVKMGTIILGNP